MQTTGCGSPSGRGPLGDPVEPGEGRGGLNPPCHLHPTGTGCARTAQAESHIRVTAAGRPGTGPAGPSGQEPEYLSPRQCLRSHSTSEPQSKLWRVPRCKICRCAGEMRAKWLNLFACRFEWLQRETVCWKSRGVRVWRKHCQAWNRLKKRGGGAERKIGRLGYVLSLHTGDLHRGGYG